MSKGFQCLIDTAVAINGGTVLDAIIVMAYFIIPITLLYFVRRFRSVLLQDLQNELHWFSLLTCSGGMDHLLTAFGILPTNIYIKSMPAHD
jgi:hypothetical protein